jgi:hypothetical protein
MKKVSTISLDELGPRMVNGIFVLVPSRIEVQKHNWCVWPTEERFRQYT